MLPIVGFKASSACFGPVVGSCETDLVLMLHITRQLWDLNRGEFAEMSLTQCQTSIIIGSININHHMFRGSLSGHSLTDVLSCFLYPGVHVDTVRAFDLAYCFAS